MSDPFDKLRHLLDNEYSWPEIYRFKFIAAPSLIQDVVDVVEKKAVVDKVSETASRTGKYISVSIHVKIDSTETVIDIYKEVGQIKGVISL